MERKLIHYLPYAVRDFAEYQGITTGEQPEFELVWDAHEEVFVNQFVDTALDYGLSRWEKMLNIFPKSTDTLESRRVRIKAKLNNFAPYTIRALARMMTVISNGEPFELTIEPGSYFLSITTQWTGSGQIAALNYLIENIVPYNIAISNTWNMPRQIYIAARPGATTEARTELEVWPRTIRSVEVTKAAAVGAVTEHHGRIEIYPAEQEES